MALCCTPCPAWLLIFQYTALKLIDQLTAAHAQMRHRLAAPRAKAGQVRVGGCVHAAGDTWREQVKTVSQDNTRSTSFAEAGVPVKQYMGAHLF